MNPSGQTVEDGCLVPTNIQGVCRFQLEGSPVNYVAVFSTVRGLHAWMGDMILRLGYTAGYEVKVIRDPDSFCSKIWNAGIALL